ncbi:MAG: dihydroorotase [Treponema sp.]|nr:dihydroorotase [Treponema sp.]
MALLIYNARLVDKDIDCFGSILCENGMTRSIFQGCFTNEQTVLNMAKSVLAEDGFSSEAKIEIYDLKGLILTPSFVDMHVHFRYPGLTEKEDLNTGLHAAASGGYGVVVAMPNTKPVVSSQSLALQIEKEAAEIGLSKLFQSVSITEDFGGESVTHLSTIEKKYIPLITEDGKEVMNSSVMLQGMKIAAEKGIIVGCHCEDPFLAKEAKTYREKALEIMKKNNLSAFGTSETDLALIPKLELNKIDDFLTEANNLLHLAENVSTARNIELAKKANCNIHLDHVSTRYCIDLIRCEKTKHNQNISCEVTPHHIALCGSKEPFIRALVNPPLRSEDDRLALIEGIKDGTVDVISTDHAPHTLDDKAKGAPGFTGLETSFAVCNTMLVKQNQINQKKLSELMSANPSRLLGLKKGLLRTGYDADFTVVDPDEQWTVNSSEFFSKGKATPFEGMKLSGKVKGLFLDGKQVLQRF